MNRQTRSEAEGLRKFQHLKLNGSEKNESEINSKENMTSEKLLCGHGRTTRSTAALRMLPDKDNIKEKDLTDSLKSQDPDRPLKHSRGTKYSNSKVPQSKAPHPAVVVSMKASELGRELIMHPLTLNHHLTQHDCSTLPQASAPCTAPPPASILMPSNTHKHVKVAYESRRRAACAIAAAAVAVAPPPLTRAAKAAAVAVAAKSTQPPFPTISEDSHGMADKENLEQHAGGRAAVIALPACVPVIDQEALTFQASAASLLGEGAYGSVYQGRYRGQPVAVKVQKLCLDDQDDLDELSVEAVLGSSLHHPGLLRTMAASIYSHATAPVRCYELSRILNEKTPSKAQTANHEVHMVMELMAGGSVLAAFKGKNIQQGINLLLAASVAEQVAWALDFLHSSCGMLHLDVKGANVLMRFDGPPGTVFAKLADFGLTMRSKEVAGEDWARDRGTPRYMAPEFWDEDLADAIGEAADVYALGCVMWEMAHEGHGFLEDKSASQVARLKGRATMDMPTGSLALNAYASLAQKCRSVVPEDRPAVRDVALELKHLCENLRISFKSKYR